MTLYSQLLTTLTVYYKATTRPITANSQSQLSAYRNTHDYTHRTSVSIHGNSSNSLP